MDKLIDAGAFIDQKDLTAIDRLIKDDARKNPLASLQVTNPFTLEMTPNPADDLERSAYRINKERLEKPFDLDLNELIPVIKDILAGDANAKNIPQYSCLNLANIKAALDWLYANNQLNDGMKAMLAQDSWRLAFRAKPPTGEEFLGYKYIGPQSETLYDPVRDAFIEGFNPMRPYRTMVLTPCIGWGKEALNSSLVRTYTGSKPIGDINVGDEVCTPAGGITKVVGVFPQGFKKDLYTVTFKDGRSVVVGAEHLWRASSTLNSRVWDKELKKEVRCRPVRIWKTVTTKQIIDDYSRNPKARWCVPLPRAVCHEEKKHLLNSYTLGAFLGDGCFATDQPILVGDDKEVFDHVQASLPTDIQVTFSEPMKVGRSVNYQLRILSNKKRVRKELYRLNLSGTTSDDKFIPEEYLYDSIANRWELLRGLMDTDGFADKKGRTSFGTNSERLRDDVCTLVRGLGGLASWETHKRSGENKAKRKTEGRDSADKPEWLVFIQMPDNSEPLFYIKRKQERVDANFSRDRKRRNTEFLFIKSIEKAPDGEATCIAVEDPEKLFLINDYIVTHNSLFTVLANLYIAVCTSLMWHPYKFFGQSQPLDCEVWTTSGPKKMGDVKVGDKVLTPSGKETDVIEIHPQGKIPTYEIELDDGRKTRCSAQHLWKVSYRRGVDGEKIWETVNTQFMIDHPELEFEIPES